MKQSTNFSPEAFIAEYHATNGNPKVHKMIPCTVTGQMVSMFGDNLHRRIRQYGTVENLVATFVSRAGKGIVNPKPEKKEKVKKPRVLQRAVKRAHGTKKEAVEEVYSGTLTVPNRNYPPIDYNNPDHMADLTRTGCLRPDIFLDSYRCCNYCLHQKLCIAPCKRFINEETGRKIKHAK